MLCFTSYEVQLFYLKVSFTIVLEDLGKLSTMADLKYVAFNLSSIIQARKVIFNFDLRNLSHIITLTFQSISSIASIEIESIEEMYFAFSYPHYLKIKEFVGFLELNVFQLT